MSRKSGPRQPTMRLPFKGMKQTGAQRKAELKRWRRFGEVPYGVKHTGGRGRVRTPAREKAA